jgi:hypothetical protein
MQSDNNNYSQFSEELATLGVDVRKLSHSVDMTFIGDFLADHPKDEFESCCSTLLKVIYHLMTIYPNTKSSYVDIIDLLYLSEKRSDIRAYYKDPSHIDKLRGSLNRDAKNGANFWGASLRPGMYLISGTSTLYLGKNRT